MADLFKSNEFYIELKQERYYYSGDTISGDIVLNLKKPTKTNNVKISLEGSAEIDGKTVSIYSTSLYVAEPPEGEKSYILDACTHRFPFSISIPKASKHRLPSTLKIPGLLKVRYRIIAVHSRPFMIVEKLCPTVSETVTILEKINVESEEFKGEQSQTTDVSLTSEDEKAKVTATMEKRAAIKGDTIPITVTIHHTGQLTKKKGIRLQLMRYVYYGKNKNEVFGPKVLAETTTDIDLIGKKIFNLKFPIPKTSLCPTVHKSCSAFRIEYNIMAKINLNQDNRYKLDRASDIVSFVLPLIIGTLPKYDFSIEDDEEEDLSGSRIDDQLDYDRVFEKMKELDVHSMPTTPVSIDPVSPSAIQFQKPNEYEEERPRKGKKPLPRLQEELPELVQSPILSSVPENTSITIISPPLDYLASIQSSTKMELHTQPILFNHRQESRHTRSPNRMNYVKKGISSHPPPVPPLPPPLPPRRSTLSSIQNKPLPKPGISPPPLPSRPISASSTPILPTYPGRLPFQSSASQPTLPTVYDPLYNGMPVPQNSNYYIHRGSPYVSPNTSPINNQRHSFY